MLRSNESELAAVVLPGDIVLLHDPQTAGLAPALRDRGAIVVWRSHIGEEGAGERSAEGWRFLAPYLAAAHATVFSRAGYIPEGCHLDRTRVIRDQVVDGETGVLVDDPTDLDAVGAAIARLLAQPTEARRLGEAAGTGCAGSSLAPRHLCDYVDLLEALLEG